MRSGEAKTQNKTGGGWTFFHWYANQEIKLALPYSNYIPFISWLDQYCVVLDFRYQWHQCTIEIPKVALCAVFRGIDMLHTMYYSLKFTVFVWAWWERGFHSNNRLILICTVPKMICKTKLTSKFIQVCSEFCNVRRRSRAKRKSFK